MRKKLIARVIAASLIITVPSPALIMAEDQDIIVSDADISVEGEEILSESPDEQANGDYVEDLDDMTLSESQEQNYTEEDGNCGELEESESGDNSYLGSNLIDSSSVSHEETSENTAQNDVSESVYEEQNGQEDNGFVSDGEELTDPNEYMEAEFVVTDSVNSESEEDIDSEINVGSDANTDDEDVIENPEEPETMSEPVFRTADQSFIILGGEYDRNLLFENYLKEKVFYFPEEQTGDDSLLRGYSTLNDAEGTLYEFLHAGITDVAAGTRTDTVFTVPVSELFEQKQWTEEELGTAIVEDEEIVDEAMEAVSAALNIDYEAVLHALLEDCADELYWYDMSAETSCGGYEISAVPIMPDGFEQNDNVQSEDTPLTDEVSQNDAAPEEIVQTGEMPEEIVQNDNVPEEMVQNDEMPEEIVWNDAAPDITEQAYNVEYVMEISGDITISLPVAAGYVASESTDVYTTDPSAVLTAKEAAEHAQDVVDEAASLSDYEKLTVFKTKICELAGYNSLIEDAQEGMGEAQQLVWVFDNDPTTESSGRGYAAAFQYLFDRSEFKDPLTCITVTGIIHDYFGNRTNTWNVVRMEDGMNYLSDIADCDSVTSDEDKESQMFLAGTRPGSPAAGYTFSRGDNEIVYLYDEITLEKFRTEQLILAKEKYIPAELRTTADEKKTFAKKTEAGTNIAVTGVKLDKTSLSLMRGVSATLKATVTPSNATDKTVTWKSSNTSIVQVDKNGKVIVNTMGKVGSATITVTTNNGKKTAQCQVRVWYTDVPASHSFQQAVYWAADNGITGGMGTTGSFGVNGTTTRGQVVTFLWRFAGKPEPYKNTQTFSDVPTSHSFYKAIQWASEQGITGGYTGSRAGQFGPNDYCTRGQIMTFIWRYFGKPEPASYRQTFGDVPTSHNFFKAIQWASENGVTAGYSDGTFGVDTSCTRGHCVTFLYRIRNYSGGSSGPVQQKSGYERLTDYMVRYGEKYGSTYYLDYSDDSKRIVLIQYFPDDDGIIFTYIDKNVGETQVKMGILGDEQGSPYINSSIKLTDSIQAAGTARINPETFKKKGNNIYFSLSNYSSVYTRSEWNELFNSAVELAVTVWDGKLLINTGIRMKDLGFVYYD